MEGGERGRRCTKTEAIRGGVLERQNTKQKKRDSWKQGHKVFLDEGERVRKQRGGVCGLEGGGRVPGSSLPSIFDAPAHFHYFWLDADEGSSRQSGTKVHLSCWPTLAATKRALWGGFSLMDGQQRRLGHRVTPEPLDILAFSGRKKYRKSLPFFFKCSNLPDSETGVPHWRVCCWNQWQCQPPKPHSKFQRKLAVKEYLFYEYINKKGPAGGSDLYIENWSWQ